MVVPKLKLNNGFEIPAIGLGTFAGKEMTDVIKLSIDLGYRLVDTAFIYQNEKEIGAGIEEKIKEGVVKREDLFIVTKLWNTKHKPEDVIIAMKESLTSLRMDYVDLYLMHWPFAVTQTADKYAIFEGVEDDIPFEDTWKAMEKCVQMGYTKSIGLSNFNSVQIERILKISEIKPVVNQVECNPYMSQEKLNKFCQERNILLMAYSPFYAPNRLVSESHGLNLFEEEIIKELAEKHGKSPSQIILRYLTQCNVIPVPKSDNPERLKLNINIFDFTLSEKEFEKMKTLHKNLRCTEFTSFRNLKEYPFNVEF